MTIRGHQGIGHQQRVWCILFVFDRKVHWYLRLEDSLNINIIMPKNESYTLISIDVCCTSTHSNHLLQQYIFELLYMTMRLT